MNFPEYTNEIFKKYKHAPPSKLIGIKLNQAISSKNLENINYIKDNFKLSKKAEKKIDKFIESYINS